MNYSDVVRASQHSNGPAYAEIRLNYVPVPTAGNISTICSRPSGSPIQLRPLPLPPSEESDFSNIDHTDDSGENASKDESHYEKLFPNIYQQISNRGKS